MFSQDDIDSHIAREFSRCGVAQYDRVGQYARRDEHGEGVEGHKAKLQRERDERLSLATVATSKFVSKLRWTR